MWPGRRSCLLFAVGLALSLPVVGHATDVVIADDAFPGSNWTTLVSANNGATSAESQAAGGNPGTSRYMAHNLPSPSSIVVYHFYTAATYNPSVSGAIDSIDYREDQIEFSPPFFGAAIGARPALRQGGIPYYGPDLTYTSTSWTTRSLPGLTAASFSDGSTSPDFSASGGPIEFGYVRGNTNSPGGSFYVTQHGIDNWSYTLHTTPVTGVGDPPPPPVPTLVAGPNPFSGAIDIELSVPGDDAASVTIHDVHGRLVRTLADGRANERLRMAWDGRDDAGRPVAGGPYFVRSRVGERTAVRKIQLIR
jgi:hypothetical protein